MLWWNKKYRNAADLLLHGDLTKHYRIVGRALTKTYCPISGNISKSRIRIDTACKCKDCCKVLSAPKVEGKWMEVDCVVDTYWCSDCNDFPCRKVERNAERCKRERARVDFRRKFEHIGEIKCPECGGWINPIVPLLLFMHLQNHHKCPACKQFIQYHVDMCPHCYTGLRWE